jgi:arginine:ornithine antiporter / lysine permease
MASSTTQKFSLWTLSAMVVGSMVGAGIFSLPQTFGRVTGVFGSWIAWLISGVGMLMLALVFQTLAQRKPDLDAGVYAYAKAGFGEYWGFLSALGYWAGSCIGNVSYFVLIKSTLGAFFPIFGEGNTIPAITISSAILWTVHFLILRGVKQAAVLNTIVTIAKIIPILVFLVILAMSFKAGIFRANFLGGGGGYDLGNLFEQVRGTMLVSVFVFIGVEGASVYSRYARNRKDVGIATVLGFLGVLCLMVLVTTLSYSVVLRQDLATLRNPSMAGVLEAVVGRWGSIFVSAGLIISVLGAYLSWTLLCAEVLYSAAENQTMPAFLAGQNANAVPSAALWLTNIVVQIFLILTLFARYAFTLALELTSSMTLIPYLLVAAYALKLGWRGESYEAERNQRRRDLMIAGLAVFYTAWLLYAAGMKFLLLSAVIYAPGTVLFLLARREQHVRVFTAKEWVAFGAAAVAGIFAIIGIASGSIAI